MYKIFGKHKYGQIGNHNANRTLHEVGVGLYWPIKLANRFIKSRYILVVMNMLPNGWKPKHSKKIQQQLQQSSFMNYPYQVWIPNHSPW